MRILVRVMALAMALVALQAQAAERPRFASVDVATPPPIGWIQFCKDYPKECEVKKTSGPRKLAADSQVWGDLVHINKWVNARIKPMIDFEHYGIIEKWAYPDDGYGDCEDYVLLKRRLLMGRGFPKEVLLITVVRDLMGEGHAVLTVVLDEGEFILDNQRDKILLWGDTGYHFRKRQSQWDPNTWVSLHYPAPSVVGSR